jgi:nucleotidyltransferase substrate binding protein (TIGR01987 family)
MSLRTENLARCIQTLESSLLRLRASEAGSIDYEIYRNAVIKGFELTLEIAGKLVRRALKVYETGSRAVDDLTYKEAFRRAAKHGLLDPAAVVRWFEYRENRNTTAHDYGELFAEKTLALLFAFINDARSLEIILKDRFDHGS